MVVETMHAFYKKLHADSFTPQLLHYYDTSCKQPRHIHGRVMDIDACTLLGFAEGFVERTEDVQMKLRLASQIPPPL